MKIRIFVVVLFLKWIISSGQIHEIGIVGGASNYIGDIGRTSYIHPVHSALGVIYKWNKNTRYSYRFSLIYSKIDGNDERSELDYRLQRGFKFVNNITEANVGFEFNFFDFDLHHLDYQFTPYISTGISVFRYDSRYYVGKTASLYEENAISYAIPMIFGIKTRISQRLVLGVELGARYTFTDNLDGSNPELENVNYNKIGNENSNDWYVFSLATLTYTFGKNPCYCRL